MKRLLSVFSALLVLTVCLLTLPAGCAAGSPEDLRAGEDFTFEEIQEFYYTVDASTDPPYYQRYRLYREDGKHFLYHETREGGGWPQTEADITVSGTVELTEEQWAAFCDTLSGGTARVREETDGDGDEGPWTFIYRDGGEEDGREFLFESWEKRTTFEELCAGIRATQADAALPSVNEALAAGVPEEKTEVRDGLEEYSVFNDSFEDFTSEFRLLVLQREAPEKEFTANKVYPPFEDNPDGFPDDFMGVDLGSARVWLRGDLMQKIPAQYRAASLEDATYLLVAETLYDMDGSIAESEYKENYDDELPEFESVEEMALYLLAHPKEVEYVTYYPKFGVYSLVTLYEVSTKKCMLYDYDYTPSTRFARNPEAALQWDRMCYIARLLSALGAEQGADPDAAASLLSLLDFLPDAQKDLWTSYLAAGESAQAYQSISEYYWSMAEELRNLDPSDEHREIYGLILPERNALALQLFADYCEYGGFERSVGSIESSGDYMADADPAWADEKLMEIVGIFAAY